MILERDQAWLARESGVSPSSISDLMTKGTIPRADRAIAISKALGVDFEWLATGATASRDALDSRADDRSAYDRELLDCAARLSAREKNALLMMARTLAGDIDAPVAPRTLHGHPNPYRAEEKP